MSYDPNVTASHAKTAVDQRLSIARGRRMPQTLGLIAEAADRNTYHVFNVGPWPHVINAGSIGNYVVPPCPPDKPYVECRRIIKGIETEYVPKDEFEYNPLMTDGWHIACELVGDGRGRAPAQSLRHYGLFPSKTEIPSQADITAARKMLHTRCEDIVREARDLHAMDRKLFAQIVNRNRHWKAAEVLNLDSEPWMTEQVATKRLSCVFCGAKNDDMAVKCSNCHEIINVSRYRELKAEQEAVLAGPLTPERKKPGPKPKNPIEPEGMIGDE
jgi:hypothetical protein